MDLSTGSQFVPKFILNKSNMVLIEAKHEIKKLFAWVGFYRLIVGDMSNIVSINIRYPIFLC